MKKEIGGRGEACAGEYLRGRGYTIIQSNFHSRFGEIDLIARKESYLVFAEVKTRARSPLVQGVYSVTPQKQEKLRKTAMLYLQQNACNLQPRFDVLIVDHDGGLYRVTNHLENAF